MEGGGNMVSNVETIRHKIILLRKLLQSMIDAKGDLLDPDILCASSLLDDILNEYDKVKN
ncbi:MAG: hypothetical protein K0R54_4767 [Clostridiaceae bacterium]|nr:hypothetical protein [Clostridiaceae bacterium]